MMKASGSTVSKSEPNEGNININTKLLDKSTSISATKNESSFIASSNWVEEMKLMSLIFIKIASANIAELFPQILSNIFIGHLSNASLLLSACGLARTFCNIMGLAQAWAFSSALYILIPQCIGAAQPQLMAIYVQRAFWVCLTVAIIATILQFFGGEIMCIIGEPVEFCPIIGEYCQALIPLIYGTVFLTITQRVGQALNFNAYLFYSVLIPAILALPLNYIFVFYLEFGYIGTAIVIDICIWLSFFLSIAYLIYKGYGWIFIPLPLNKVFQFDGMKQYILLALPGLAQSSMSWLISEMLVILSGFIANPSIVVATTVVCSSVNLFLTMIGAGMSNSINIRLGKYIGAGYIFGAQMVAKCAIIGDTLTMIIVGTFLYLTRNVLVTIWTHEQEVVTLASSLIVIGVIPRMLGFNLYVCLSGAFRGLGYPKITAIVVFIAHYGIGLPLALILLFYFNLRDYSQYGLYIIWLCVMLGYLISGITLIGILIFKIDIKKAANKSQMRIKRTMNGYGSIKDNKS